MSGFKGKFHRQHLCSRFTKDLVRRSRSRCECCSRSGSRLDILEIEPLLEEPAPDHALFLCESCIKQIQRPEKMNPHDWRCLHETIWSELPVLQVLSVRLLRRLADRNETWAEELLEQCVLDSKIEEWSNQAT
jgi:protein PhnA